MDDTSVVDAQGLSKNAANLKPVLGTTEIMQILQHRLPFLLLDRVLYFVPGKSAIGLKNVSVNEPFFAGHFSDRQIMWGLLQVEALAQLDGIFMRQQPISDGVGDFSFSGV